MSNFKPMTSQEAHDLLYSKYEMEDDSDPMIRPYSKEEGWVVQMGEDSYTNDMPNAPYEDAKLLAHAERALRTIMEMGKKLTTANDARKAHELLDELDVLGELSQDQEQLLRSFLPYRPKYAPLEDLLTRVHAAWLRANPSDWGFDTPAEHHDWLFDLRNDLIRIIEDQDAPANTPAHPEFLETAADYAAAPEGTIVALDDSGTVWLKRFGGWRNTAGDHGVESASIALDSRRILRWGWGK